MRNLYKSCVHESGRSGPKRIEKYDEVIKLRLDGHTYDAISYFLGTPRTTIASICQKNKIGGKIKNSPKVLKLDADK